MLLFTHNLIAVNKTLDGINCQYITVIPGKQKVNRLAILNSVLSVLTDTFPKQSEEALKEVTKNPSKLKAYVHIDKRMFDLLTRYVQRKAILVYSDIQLKSNVHIINDKIFIHVYQVSSKYQTATGSIIPPAVKNLSKPKTLGEAHQEHTKNIKEVPVSEPTLTIESVVHKVQEAIKSGTTVLYCKQAIRDIGLCNAITPQVFLFKTEGIIVKKLSDLQIDEFSKGFTYTKTENLF